MNVTIAIDSLKGASLPWRPDMPSKKGSGVYTKTPL